MFGPAKALGPKDIAGLFRGSSNAGRTGKRKSGEVPEFLEVPFRGGSRSKPGLLRSIFPAFPRHPLRTSPVSRRLAA